MTRQVRIRVSGSQISDGGQDEVELAALGDYFLKDKKHYIIYEEIGDDGKAATKNTIKVTENSMEVIKRGSVNAHMVFQKGKKDVSCYQTPFGEMVIGVSTDGICIEETEGLLKATVAYSLDMNYEHVSDCRIALEVRPK